MSDNSLDVRAYGVAAMYWCHALTELLIKSNAIDKDELIKLIKDSANHNEALNRYTATHLNNDAAEILLRRIPDLEKM